MNTEHNNTAVVTAHEAGHINHTELKTFGFWLYLMSDLIIFSVLFVTFVVLGRNYAGGENPKELFHLSYVFIETILLLLSSVAFGFAMINMQQDKKRNALVALFITALMGLGFIVMEINEFHELISSGNTPDKSGFLSSFFTLVGTHGTHVFFGLIWIFVMIIQLAKQGFSEGVRSRLMRLSLYWHFLDLVWIGVFTVVYLLGFVQN